jgi:hypothetical protein
MIVLMVITLIPEDVFADANAKRRNRCNSAWLRYIASACVNGKNCGKLKGDDKKCQHSPIFGAAKIEFKNYAKLDNCQCQYNSAPGTNKLATWAYAESNDNRVHSSATKYTSCKRYKAGSNKIFQFQNAGEDESHNDILNKAEIMADEEIYDYVNNSIHLSNFKGSLYIESFDYINEYAIINIEIATLSVDELTGDTIRTILTYAQAKFLNGQFVVIGNQSIFNVNDFDFIDNGVDGISASFEFLNKLILLDSNITENMDIEISMTADVGNMEDGESEVEIDPVSLNVAYNMVNHNAEIDIVTDIQRSGMLRIRNASGNVLYTQNNVVIEPSISNHYSISTNEFGIATFYVVEFQTDDGIFVAKTFIKLN